MSRAELLSESAPTRTPVWCRRRRYPQPHRSNLTGHLLTQPPDPCRSTGSAAAATGRRTRSAASPPRTLPPPGSTSPDVPSISTGSPRPPLLSLCGPPMCGGILPRVGNSGRQIRPARHVVNTADNQQIEEVRSERRVAGESVIGSGVRRVEVVDTCRRAASRLRSQPRRVASESAKLESLVGDLWTRSQQHLRCAGHPFLKVCSGRRCGWLSPFEPDTRAARGAGEMV